MRILPTMLCIFLLCLTTNQSYSANHYKIQIGAFVKKIPFTHFAFSGVTDVYMDTDKNNVHRYYLRTTFEEYPTAIRVKDSLVVRGFSNATVLSINEEVHAEAETILEKTKLLSPTLPAEDISFSKTIYYEFDQYKLTNKSKKELNDFLSELKIYPDLKIAIIGHTDSKGNAAYNVELSKNRVRTVRRYLKKQGISQDQIIPLVCGESSPLINNTCELGLDLPDNRKRNRRVVIFSINETGELMSQYPIEQTVHPVLIREVLKN